MTHADLHTLLRDDGWMRGVAAGLLSEPAEADDAVQEAWLADVRGGGRGAERRRPWLAGVLRRRAARVRGRERQLADRAEDAAREASSREAPAAADVAAARELKRIVAEAILDLDEPLREAVHLTYFAELSTREVAARTGVSPTAVRKRLERAHDELRRRLGDARGERWPLAIAPFLASVTDPASSDAFGAESSIPESRRIMRSFEWAAAAVVLTTALTAYAVLSASGPRSSRSLSRAADAAPTTARPTAPATAPARTPEPGPGLTGPTAEGDTRLFGQYLLPDGTPAAGAAWSLEGYVLRPTRKSRSAERADPFALAGVLDAEGRLDHRFDCPPDLQARLEVNAEGAATEAYKWREVPKGTTVPLGTVRLRESATLLVRFVDEEGDPVDDRRWSVSVSGGVAIGGGRTGVSRRESVQVGISTHEVRGLPAGSTEVHAQTPGWRGRPATLVVRAGESTTYDVVVPADLPPPQSASGGATPGPGGGAPSVPFVWLSFASDRDRFVAPTVDAAHVRATDADGEACTVEGFGSGIKIEPPFTPPLEVAIEDPRYEPITLSDVTPGGRTVSIPTSRVRFRLEVSGPDGAEVEQYRVLARDAAQQGSWEQILHDGSTPLEGGLVENVMFRAPVRLIVSTPGASGQVVVEELPPSVDAVVPVELSPRVHVTGTVTRTDGTPAAGAEVLLVAPAEVDDGPHCEVIEEGTVVSEPERRRFVVGRTRADASGAYSLAPDAAGTYLVLATNGAGVDRWSDLLEVTTTTPVTDIVLPRGVTITGQLAVPPGVDPRLLAVSPAFEGKDRFVWREFGALVDDEGRFTLTELPPGPIELTLGVSGSWVVSEREPLALLEPEAGESVVVASDGAELMPGLLTVVGGAAPGQGASWRIALSRPGTSDPYPSARFKHHGRAPGSAGPYALQPGAWSVRLSGPNWVQLAATTVELESGGEATVPLACSVSRRIVTVLVDGEPFRSETVYVRSAAPGTDHVSFRFQTDAEGKLDVAFDDGPVDMRSRPRPSAAEPGASATVAWPPEPGAVIELD